MQAFGERVGGKFPQCWNRYAYVNNTPLTAADPLGLEAVCVKDSTSGYNSCSHYGGGYSTTEWDNWELEEWLRSGARGGSGGSETGGGGGGGETTPEPAPTPSPTVAAKRFAGCVLNNMNELGPANLIGLGGSNAARGALAGPVGGPSG